MKDVVRTIIIILFSLARAIVGHKGKSPGMPPQKRLFPKRKKTQLERKMVMIGWI